MPALLLPAALAALLAMVAPLLVHLARRSEALPMDFAALRWLRQKPRPRSRLRFDEWPLLALRLLLVALLAVWLARPVLVDSADQAPVVAVLPGITPAPLAPGTRGVWLAPGFPPLDGPAPAPSANVISLVRQLDSELAAGVGLRIVVPQVLQGVDAERPRLSRRITWQGVAGAMPTALPVSAQAPPFLSLHRPPGPDRGLGYLRAAAAAWTLPGRPAAFDIAPPGAPMPATPRVLVWLAPGALPEAVRGWVASGGTALVAQDVAIEPGVAIIAWRDGSGAPLVDARSLGRGRLLRFTRPLAPGAMPELLEADFPLALSALLSPPRPLSARVAARDLEPTTGAPAWPQPARDLQPWLALMVALLLVAERWLATRRGRGVAP